MADSATTTPESWTDFFGTDRSVTGPREPAFGVLHRRVPVAMSRSSPKDFSYVAFGSSILRVRYLVRTQNRRQPERRDRDGRHEISVHPGPREAARLPQERP